MHEGLTDCRVAPQMIRVQIEEPARYVAQSTSGQSSTLPSLLTH